MTLPPNTHDHLYGSGPEITWSLPGDDGIPCEGAKFHSPRPLFTEEVALVRPDWWPGVNTAPPGAPRASLCGTCRDNLDILLQMLHHADGALDWEIRREFGNDLRALAKRGWEWFAERRPAEQPDSPPKG